MNLKVVILIATSTIGFGQTPADSTSAAQPFKQSSRPVPKHVVYEHFLRMVDDSDRKALMAGDLDAHAFARPFARAGFEDADLDTIRAEAKALVRDLDTQDQAAKVLIDAYRAQAMQAVAAGQPVPRLPEQIGRFQAVRTALAVNHMVSLQSKLGKDKTDQLEVYFKRVITPRVRLTVLAHPAVDPASVPVHQ